MADSRRVYQRVPDARELIEAVNKLPVVDCFDYVGPTYKTTFDRVARAMVNFIADEGKINELVEIYFVPVVNRSNGNLTWETECYAIFDPDDSGASSASIWYKYPQTGNNRVKTIVDVGKYSGANGIFGASAMFYSTMAKYAMPSSIIEKDGRISIRIEEYDDENSSKVAALVRLDFMKVIAAALAVSSEDYVNMNILSTEQTKNDYAIMIQKYIDTSGTRKGRKGSGGRGGLNVDSIKSGLRYRVRPNQNQGGRRGF